MWTPIERQTVRDEIDRARAETFDARSERDEWLRMACELLGVSRHATVTPDGVKKHVRNLSAERDEARAEVERLKDAAPSGWTPYGVRLAQMDSHLGAVISRLDRLENALPRLLAGVPPVLRAAVNSILDGDV